MIVGTRADQVQRYSSSQSQNWLTLKSTRDDHRAAAEQRGNQSHAFGVDVIERKHQQGPIRGS